MSINKRNDDRRDVHKWRAFTKAQSKERKEQDINLAHSNQRRSPGEKRSSSLRRELHKKIIRSKRANLPKGRRKHLEIQINKMEIILRSAPWEVEIQE